MSKKKIAVLSHFPAWLYCDDLPKVAGHYEVWLVSMFEAFKSIPEYDVHWIVPHKLVKNERSFKIGNQTIHLIRKAKMTIGLYTAYWWDRRRIAKCIRNINPDLLHAWGTEDSFGLCLKDFKGKRLLSVQGLLKACAERARLKTFERRQSLYEPGVFRAIEHITTESPWAADRVHEIAPEADVTLWEYAAEQRFYKIERTPTDEPSCLMAGTNTPVKDVPTAIAAFSRPELRHVKLYMAGVDAGAYENLPENIIPLGFVDRDEVARLLSTAWGLVHTSLADTGPTIVKEARVVGIPVVLTSDCGSKQHVVHGKSGFVIKPKDVDALIEAVLQMTKDKETSLAMGAYHHEECRKALSEQTMIDGIRAIYAKILGSKD